MHSYRTREPGGPADPASDTPAAHQHPAPSPTTPPIVAVYRARSLRPGDLIARPAGDATEIIAVRAVDRVSDTITIVQASDGRTEHVDAAGMMPVHRAETVCTGCDAVPGRCEADCPGLAARRAAFTSALIAIGTDTVLSTARFRLLTEPRRERP